MRSVPLWLAALWGPLHIVLGVLVYKAGHGDFDRWVRKGLDE